MFRVNVTFILFFLFCFCWSTADAAGGSAKSKTKREREGEGGGDNPRQQKKPRVDAAPEPMDDDDDDDDTPIPFANLPTDIQRAKRGAMIRRIRDSANGKAGLVDLAVKEGAFPDRPSAEKTSGGKTRTMEQIADAICDHRLLTAPPKLSQPLSTSPPATQSTSDTSAALTREADSAKPKKKVATDPLNERFRSYPGVSIMQKGEARRRGYTMASACGSYADDQEVPVCVPCKRAFARDVTNHDLNNTHMGSRSHIRKSTPSSATGGTAPPTNNNNDSIEIDTHERVAELCGMLGISFLAATKLLFALKGQTIPHDGINVQTQWTKHGQSVYKRQLAHIATKLKDKPFVLVHDGVSTDHGDTSVIFIAQTRDYSVCLPVQYSSVPFTADTIKEALNASLAECELSLSQVCLIRSDRGGSTGAASRQLSGELGVPFVSCLAHLLNNACTDLKKVLKEKEHLMHHLLHLSNYAFCDAKKQKAWKRVQSELCDKSSLTKISQLLERLKKLEHTSTAREKTQMLEKCRSMCLEAVVEAQRESIANADTFEGLVESLSRVYADSKENVEATAPVCRAPRIYDTRFVTTLTAAEHLESRVKALYLFIARQCKKPSASASTKTLAKLLQSEGFPKVQSTLTEYVEATATMRDALRKYSDAMVPKDGGAGTLWAEVQSLCDSLEEAKKPGVGGEFFCLVSETLFNGFSTRWSKQLEPGYFFYQALRQLTPAGFQTMFTCDSLISHEDVRTALSLGPEVTRAFFEKYEEQARVWHGSATAFWSSFPDCVEDEETKKLFRLVSERVLLFLSVPASCTSPDSASSVLKTAIPSNRGGLSSESQRRMSLLALNQDVDGIYPPECRFRHGFPTIVDRESAEDDCDAKEDFVSEAADVHTLTDALKVFDSLLNVSPLESA